jgi:hypothetical protein
VGRRKRKPAKVRAMVRTVYAGTAFAGTKLGLPRRELDELLEPFDGGEINVLLMLSMTLPDSPNGESVDAEVAKAALVREARGIRSMWLEGDSDDPDFSVSLDDLSRYESSEDIAWDDDECGEILANYCMACSQMMLIARRAGWGWPPLKVRFREAVDAGVALFLSFPRMSDIRYRGGAQAVHPGTHDTPPGGGALRIRKGAARSRAGRAPGEAKACSPRIARAGEGMVRAARHALVAGACRPRAFSNRRSRPQRRRAHRDGSERREARRRGAHQPRERPTRRPLKTSIRRSGRLSAPFGLYLDLQLSQERIPLPARHRLLTAFRASRVLGFECGLLQRMAVTEASPRRPTGAGLAIA